MARKLEGVKPGDRIAAARRGMPQGVFTVERVTKVLAVCQRGISFRIDNGVQQGTAQMMHSTWGKLVSDDELKEAEAELQMKRRIVAARTAIREVGVTAENLEAAEAFIAASQKKEPTNSETERSAKA